MAAGDLDGDIDYLATNFGLNTKYKASEEEPELLYYGDLEGAAGQAAFAVRLAGPKGNPTGVGARVTVDFGAGGERTAELAAGGGGDPGD